MLHILGGVLPVIDTVEVMLVVLHAAYSRWGLTSDGYS